MSPDLHLEPIPAALECMCCRRLQLMAWQIYKDRQAFAFTSTPTTHLKSAIHQSPNTCLNSGRRPEYLYRTNTGTEITFTLCTDKLLDRRRLEPCTLLIIVKHNKVCHHNDDSISILSTKCRLVTAYCLTCLCYLP